MSRLSTMLLFPTCCPGWGSRTGKPTTFYSGINQPTNNSLIYLLFDCIQIFRHGFTVVFTAWRHAVGHVGERPNTHADGPEGCGRKSSVKYLFSPPTSSPSSHPPPSSPSPSTLILKRRVRWLAQTLMVELTLIEDTASGNKCFATHTRWVLVGFSRF